ncbi:MAG: hypothetical protein GY765_14735, partial [bacterium]|nr:hypothetical protein [bacterium]
MKKLAKMFEEGAQKAKKDDVSVTHRSLAIINAVEKLKRQGIQITKKAEMDYLIAQRHVAKESHFAGRDLLEEYRQNRGRPPQTAAPAAAPPVHGDKEQKRNPKDHPRDFQKALSLAGKLVADVENMLRAGKQVPKNKMEEYLLCKKFLEKYTNEAVL